MRGLTMAAAIIALLLLTPLSAQRRALPSSVVDARRPRLMVLLVVDQFRGDYIERFQAQWSAGLRRLTREGAWFRQVDYPYFNTVTCAGHASVSTGALPSTHGMILNGWWDRDAGKAVTCTEDPSATAIVYGKTLNRPGESAARLRAATLADELRAQLSPAGRTIAFSLKARAAVTLGGQHPDAVAWFDDSGAWVTSTAFSKKPVAQVADFVARHPIENDFGKVWTRLLPLQAYRFESPALGVRDVTGMTAAFPHVLRGVSSAPDVAFFDRWQSSPFADEYLARMALDVASQMTLGSAAASTDLLAISFSTLDKVGHDFGPNSHEIQDVLARLDRTLGELFAGLDRLVGPGLYTVALTADHGVAPIPEPAKAAGLDAGRIAGPALVAAVDRTLSEAWGARTYVARIMNTELYLEPGVYEKLRMQPAVLGGVRSALAAVPGVLGVYTAAEVVRNRFADDPIGRRLARGYFAGRSGDLLIVPRPYWMLQATGTSHGTGHGYDTRVPLLLMGRGIARGEFLTPASPIDVAPTLAFLSGVTLAAAQGRILTEALAPVQAIARTSQ
jgi:predicted AlkP superfamily pyrophosphatase or phosphodiesterase